MSAEQQPLPIGPESAAQAAMNDTASAEEIDAQNQMRYHAQVDDNMMEPYEEEKVSAIEDPDDSGGFFSFKTIMIIIAILFLLLAIYYFFFRKSGGGGEDFEGSGSIGGDFDE